MAKQPGWRSYISVVQATIPRLTDGGEELQHRCQIAWARDWAQRQRETCQWQEDQLFVSIIALCQPYALNSRVRPDQIASLWDAIHKLCTIAGFIKAVDLP
jgi:hypothetical protein